MLESPVGHSPSSRPRIATSRGRRRAKPIRILVADDHPAIRAGIAAFLKDSPGLHVLETVADGRAAVETHRNRVPDVTLMALRMPVLDGVAATSAILAGFPDARILILTTDDGDEEVYRALRAGAKGCVREDAPPEEILQAIAQVHSGGISVAPARAARLAERPGRRELTPRELEVLGFIARGRSNKEIALELSLAEPTVKTHVAGILRKLGVKSRTQAAVEALRRGLVRGI